MHVFWSWSPSSPSSSSSAAAATAAAAVSLYYHYHCCHHHDHHHHHQILSFLLLSLSSLTQYSSRLFHWHSEKDRDKIVRHGSTKHKKTPNVFMILQLNKMAATLLTLFLQTVAWLKMHAIWIWFKLQKSEMCSCDSNWPWGNICSESRWCHQMETFSALLAISAGNLMCAWLYRCVNNGEAGDLRRQRAYYDVTAMNVWLPRFPHDCLIFKMGQQTPGKRFFIYIKTGPISWCFFNLQL